MKMRIARSIVLMGKTSVAGTLLSMKPAPKPSVPVVAEDVAIMEAAAAAGIAATGAAAVVAAVGVIAETAEIVATAGSLIFPSVLSVACFGPAARARGSTFSPQAPSGLKVRSLFGASIWLRANSTNR